VVAASSALLLIPTIAGATATKPTTSAKPTIHSVQRKLHDLLRSNAQLVDAYDRAQHTVQVRQLASILATGAALAAKRHYAKAETELQVIMATQYEGGSFSTTGALLSSPSGASYINSLDTLSMLSSHSAQIVSAVAEAKKAAATAEAKAKTLYTKAQAIEATVAKQKIKITTQIAKYKKLLKSLNAAQRRAYLLAQKPTVTHAQIRQVKVSLKSGDAPNAAAAKAVAFALAQVGKPYEYGQAGPWGYDCSGLTMASWHAGGVNLPHSAAQQFNYGHHIPFSDLEPGDLLFYYSPIGHVTIYVGDGMMVSAPETGEDVAEIPANSYFSSYVGATRLVG
jgi:cell wall-associated NlpC family hydrolase